MSYDGSLDNSSIKAILMEGPEGLARWEGKGLVPIFWAIRGVTAIVPLPIKSWILFMGAKQLFLSCTTIAM